MPFDPDAYLAQKEGPKKKSGGFDPDAYLEQSAPAAPPSRAGEAALQGFGEAATLGYLPELQAAAEKILPRGGQAVDEQLRAQGFQLPEEESYGLLKQQAKARSAGLQAEEPVASALGGIGGALATAPMAGAALGKLPGLAKVAGTLPGRLAQGAAGGAITGGLMNVDAAPGEQIPARLENLKRGAGLGLLGAGVGEAVGGVTKALKGLPGKLSQKAEERAVGAAGAFKTDITRLLKKDPIAKQGNTVRDLGRFILDEDLVKAGDEITDIAARVGSRRKEVGEQLSQIYDEAAARVGDEGFDAVKLGDEILTSLSKKFKGTPGSDKAIAQVESVVANLKENGVAVPLRQLQRFREGVDDLIPYDKGLSLLSKPEKEALLSVRNAINDTIKSKLKDLDQKSGSGLLKGLERLNEKYSKLAEIDRISRNRVSSEIGNNMLSLTDKIFAGGGAAAGAAPGLVEGDFGKAAKGAAIGAGAGLISKGARTYGRPLVTKGMDASAQGLLALGKTIEDIGRSMGLSDQAKQQLFMQASKMGVTSPAQIGSLAERLAGR